MQGNFKIPKLTRIMAHKQPIYALATIDDRSLFVSGANDHLMKIWNKDELIFTQEFESEIRSICSNTRFHPKDSSKEPRSIAKTMIAISLKTQKTLFFDYESRLIYWTFQTDGIVWSSLFISPDLFLCGDTAGIVYLVDWKKKSIITIKPQIDSIRTLTYHPLTKAIIVGSQNGMISSIDIRSKAIIHSRKLPEGIIQLTFSEVTKMIYGSFGEGQIIELTEDLRVLYQWQSHISKIRAMIAHPTLPLLITGSDQGIIRNWELEQKENTESLKLGKYEVWNLCLIDDNTLIACDYSGDIFLIEF